MQSKINDLLIDSVELVQIDVKDLKVGMFVSKLDRPWLETKFWFQGFELKNQADIDAVQQQCEFVFIDVTKQTKVPQYVARSTNYTPDFLEKVQPPAKRSSFRREIGKAEVIYQKTSGLVKNFMEEVKFGRPINALAAKKAVAYCVDSVLNAPDALMLMTQLKNRDEYTAQHSMNVCIFSIALGRQVGLSVEELNHVGLCGMMHDMGKMQVPLEILNKPGSFSPEELAIMQSHTIKGWKILLATNGMYSGAVDVAFTHHERLDGQGYPRRLTVEQITPYARMVAIADMYDAVSSDRVYKKGKSHLDSIKILTESSSTGHLDPALTMKFIESLGIYPAGSLVELSSGEVAMVVEVNPKAKLKPKILMLQDAQKKPCQEFIVDLALASANFGGQPLKISTVLRADECGVDLLKYYQSGLLQKGWKQAEP
ncbi:HD-GYP domain-containing protein [Methylomonas methanica]|uniref:Metal dependent phosphohydrolase n=1 Tax=Methylomonas methanica (strain DSM 25384 / MC09) TaxID=857087 RepID=G0A510_METMM|nr:HD-GYP domain-containing protein [Methylomonas methanica]AEF99173.1 metal dependent phosphohydrolase [Methylomonas methanica MC09]